MSIVGGAHTEGMAEGLYHISTENTERQRDRSHQSKRERRGSGNKKRIIHRKEIDFSKMTSQEYVYGYMAE